MFSRLLMPAVALSVVAGCNREPTPSPEKTTSDQVVPSYQAATPASAATTGGSAVNSGTANNANAGANGASSTDGNSPTNDTAGAPRAGTTPESEALSDAQIGRITNDANASEIEQGKLARSRAKDARVKAFAERMIKHHTEAKDEQAKLKLDTAESALSAKLEREGGTTMGTLRANTGPSFDQEYIQTQVKEHQQVLDTIDHQLLPSAQNEALKAYLKKIRPTVEAHLKDARELEAKLTQPAATPNQATSTPHAATSNQGSTKGQAATPSPVTTPSPATMPK